MSPTPAPRRVRAVSTLVALALGGVLLGACSGDDQPTASPRPPSASAPGSTAADALVATGLEQITAGDLAAARESFRAVLHLDPANAWAHYNLGYLAQQDADVATAVTEYQQALGSDPELAPALYNLAILTESADLQAAVDLYRRVLAVKPDDAATHMRLGYALRHLGREDEAAQLLARGIELDPALKDVPAPTYND